MMNLNEKLVREVRRVTTLRGHLEELRGQPNVVVEPTIMIMDASLEAACVAAGSGDIAAMAASVQDLSGYEE